MSETHTHRVCQCVFWPLITTGTSPDPCLCSVPGSIVSSDIHRLPGEESVFDEDVDVFTELRQPAAVALSGEVEHGHHQSLRETLETLPRSPLALHRLQVREARSSRQSTAPD